MLPGLWGVQPAQLTAVKEDRSARVSPHRQEQAAPQKARKPRWTWPCLGGHRLCRPQHIQPRLWGMPGFRVLLKRRKLNLVVILAGVSGIFPGVKRCKFFCMINRETGHCREQFSQPEVRLQLWIAFWRSLPPTRCLSVVWKKKWEIWDLLC